jgi:hypothetical protein
MNALLKFRPDLHASELEERLLPAGANLSVIVLTTSGYVLASPFGGVVSFYFGGTSLPTPIPTSFAMTDSGGISSMQPGSIAGLPTTAPSATTAGGGPTITVGSGANIAGAPNIPSILSRNNIANDKLNSAPEIGRFSGDRTPVLPAGQSYRGGVPVNATAPAPAAEETPGSEAFRIPSQGPLDGPSIRLGGTGPRLSFDASGI